MIISNMKTLVEYINEGFFDIIKIQKQFTQLQADVTAKSEELKSESELKKYAEEVFPKYITNEKAMSFKDWWTEFYEALIKFNK